MKVAIFSPMPPERSGIADYSALLLPGAARRAARSSSSKRGAKKPPRGTDLCVYHIGNNPDAHGWIVEALRRTPGRRRAARLRPPPSRRRASRSAAATGTATSTRWSARAASSGGCSGTPCSTSASRRSGRTGRRTSTSPARCSASRPGLIVHSRHVHDRARAAGYDGPIWIVPHPAFPVPAVRAGRDRRRAALRHVRQRQREQARAAAARGVRARPAASTRRAGLLLVGATSPGFDLDRRLQRLGLDGGGLVREGYRRREPPLGADDGLRRARQPPLADDGRDLGHRDPRARARQAARRQRRRLVLGASRRRRAEGAGRRRTRSTRSWPRSSCSPRAPTCARRWARRRSSSRAREHDLDRVADLYVAAFEQAAGGGGGLRRGAAGGEPGRCRGRDRARAPPRRSIVATRLGEVELGGVTACGRVPAWAWLAGIVVLSFAVRAWLARGMLGPFIMVDELIYSEMAKSFASDLSFAVRGVAGARLRRRLSDPDRARLRALRPVPGRLRRGQDDQQPRHVARRGPAYLIARRVVGKWLALLAALLAVAVPSMVYTATVMTENAYYPVFLLAALALVALLERPSPRNHVALLRGARAGLPDAVAGRRGRRGGGHGAVPARRSSGAARSARRCGRSAGSTRSSPAERCSSSPAQRRAGMPLSSLLGSYADRQRRRATTSARRSTSSSTTRRSSTSTSGVIPVAAAIVLTARARSLDRPLQVLLAATIALVALDARRRRDLRVALRRPDPGAQHVRARAAVPDPPARLGRARARRGRACVATAARPPPSALLVLAIPFDRFVTTSAVSDTLMLLPWWAIQLHWRITLARCGSPSSARSPSRPRSSSCRGASPSRCRSIVLVVLARRVEADLVRPVPLRRQAGRRRRRSSRASAASQRDWIDRAVPAGATSPSLWTGRSDRFTVNQNEFFNRRVGQVYYTVAPDARRGRRAARRGRPAHGRRAARRTAAPCAPATCSRTAPSSPDAVPVARDPLLGMTVWKVNGPARPREDDASRASTRTTRGRARA